MGSDYLFRCSSLGKLMTEPVSVGDEHRTPEVEKIIAKSKRTDEEKATLAALKLKTLSETAKTYIRQLVAQEIFGVDFEISSKHIEKGLIVEGDSIALLNRVRGLSLVKNTERRCDGFITGECDLYDAERNRGHDLKSSWSFASFPITAEACQDKDYEWQCRGYMRLWDAAEWEVNYAMITTPDHLVGYEPQTMHFADHIPEHHRLTTWVITRDREKEALMNEKVLAARDYFRAVVAEFDRTHAKRAEETKGA